MLKEKFLTVINEIIEMCEKRYVAMIDSIRLTVEDKHLSQEEADELFEEMDESGEMCRGCEFCEGKRCALFESGFALDGYPFDLFKQNIDYFKR